MAQDSASASKSTDAVGTSYEFACPSCGYEANVCGGPDTGALVSVKTVTCLACAELVDVVTARHEWPPSADAHRAIGACPHCEGSDSVPWGPRASGASLSDDEFYALQDYGPCPKCHASMGLKPDGVTMLWD